MYWILSLGGFILRPVELNKGEGVTLYLFASCKEGGAILCVSLSLSLSLCVLDQLLRLQTLFPLGGI